MELLLSRHTARLFHIWLLCGNPGSRTHVIISFRNVLHHHLRRQVVGEVTFEHVRFIYPARPNITIYSDFSLHVTAGKVRCVVD